MENIIEYVIHLGLIEFKKIGVLLFVNKEVHGVVSGIIDTHCSNYFERKVVENGVFIDRIKSKTILLCGVCNYFFTKKTNPFDNNSPLCGYCTKKKMIHKSTAKKLFGLKEKDIQRLNYHCYFMSQTRLGYLYDLNTVKYVSCLLKIKKERDELTKPKKISIRQKRDMRIRKLLQERDITDTDEIYYVLSSQPIFCYIRNGSYGIQYSKMVLSKWKKFYEFVSVDFCSSMIIHALNIVDYFDRYIIDEEYTVDLIYEQYARVTDTLTREGILISELKKYGIRHDYKCDAFYSFIVDIRKDIHSTINEIREYHFFMNYTNFIGIRYGRAFSEKEKNRTITLTEIMMDIDDRCKRESLLALPRDASIPDFIRLKYLGEPVE